MFDDQSQNITRVQTQDHSRQQLMLQATSKLWLHIVHWFTWFMWFVCFKWIMWFTWFLLSIRCSWFDTSQTASQHCRQERAAMVNLDMLAVVTFMSAVILTAACK